MSAAETPPLDPSQRTRCEVWTRVMGYHRPVSAFNRGKQAEHRERRLFRERGPVTADHVAAVGTMVAA